MTKQKAMTLIEGATAIDAAIKSIQTRGKSMDRDIHIAACSILNHVEKHGDYTKAIKLVNAMGQSARKNALKDWFLAFGKLSWNAETKDFTFNKNAVTMLSEAIAMPFWDFKPEPEYKPFDFNASVQAILSKATKAVERGDIVPQDKIEALRKLVEVQPAH